MIYHEINDACLGVSLRHFQQWFQQYDEENPPEGECFSDEDSDEEDSDYEEIVIPKKKQAKRKLRANEAASSKRIKPNPKPQVRVPKKLVARVIPSSKGHQQNHQDHLLVRLRQSG